VSLSGLQRVRVSVRGQQPWICSDRADLLEEQSRLPFRKRIRHPLGRLRVGSCRCRGPVTNEAPARAATFLAMTPGRSVSNVQVLRQPPALERRRALLHATARQHEQ
jgi:hypothetical protein